MRATILVTFSLLIGLPPLSAETLEFDGAGNLIRNGQRSMVYNSQNKTVAVSGEAGTGDYIYKDSGSRLRKRFSFTSNPGQTTELLNPTRLMTQQTKHGARRGRVNHIYVNGMRLAALGPDAAGNPAIRYYHTDQVSSVKLTTDGKADVVARHEYRPYGGAFLATGYSPWLENPKFNSQEHDKESGLDFFNARHYDSKLGHFTSADTVIDGEDKYAGWNRYMYVQGNPVRYADPSGHGWEIDTKNVTDFWFADEPHKYSEGLRALLESYSLMKHRYVNLPFRSEENPLINYLGAFVDSGCNCEDIILAQFAALRSWENAAKTQALHDLASGFTTNSFASRASLKKGLKKLPPGTHFIASFRAEVTTDYSEDDNNDDPSLDYHVLGGVVGPDGKVWIIDFQGYKTRRKDFLSENPDAEYGDNMGCNSPKDCRAFYTTNLNVFPKWRTESIYERSDITETYMVTILPENYVKKKEQKLWLEKTRSWNLY